MAVGGSALHWGGVTNRFSAEDLTLKSRYGLATDWPLTWTDLERHYCEAERRLGVSGEPGPLRGRQAVGAVSDGADAAVVQPRGPEGVGREERHSVPGHAAGEEHHGRTADASQCLRCNTCEICPTGARYSPDFTFKQLLAAKRVTLHDQTLVRRLVASADGKRIVSAKAVSRVRAARRWSTARRRSCSRRATPGRRTCCCCPGSRIARGSSAST